MATLTAKIAADFTTILASELSVGGTTATLSSATDDDGVALPAGRYFFTLDGANSGKEHISCDLSGTALTNIKTVSRQGVETAGALRKHRIGASVSITDFAHILQINNLVNGTTDFNGSDPLKYDTDPTISDDKHFATKKYVDDTAIAGAAKATEAVYGITRLSTAAVSAVAPIAVGDNDPRLPTQAENDALVGNNTDVAVGTGNKFVTQTGLQHNAEKYAADAGSNDTYVITLSPAPTSYTNGMVVYFKANTINTGAATLNVNGLGAKTIVKGVNTTLSDGNILAGQFCMVIYDGTNFVLQNPTPTLGAKTVTTTYDLSTVSGTVNLAHGCPTTPYLVEFSYSMDSTSGTPWVSFGTGAYDGTTNTAQYTIISEAGAFQSATVATGIAINFTGNNTGAKQEAVITLTSTNIVFTWTKTSTPAGTGYIKCVAHYNA